MHQNYEFCFGRETSQSIFCKQNVAAVSKENKEEAHTICGQTVSVYFLEVKSLLHTQKLSLYWLRQVFMTGSNCSSLRSYVVLAVRNLVKNISEIDVRIWCDFDGASSLICGNKMPTRCNRGFYCRSYCLLNMFRAPLCPSSRSSRVLYSGCCLWYFVLWFFK